MHAMTKKVEPCHAPPAPESPDVGLAEWLFKGPFAGKPLIDFNPPGTFLWIVPLIEDPTLDWPWPYDDSELEAVLIRLPQGLRDACSRQIVRTARVYLAKLWSQRGGPKTKPNPIKELRRLKKAADDLMLAIKSLSGEAQNMLASRQRLHVPNAPDIGRLRYTVDAFLHEHRLLRNLSDPLPTDRRGRKVNVLERKFHACLVRIYEDAFGDKHRKGFLAFEKAVTERLERWGHLHIQEKSRQDRRRSSDRATQQRRIKQAREHI